MKKQQGFNPYLPSWEYIPDGEPHVFGDRVYVYGSHDRFNGYAFCLNDYVCYSASVDNMKEWRYEGVIYGRCDDPRNKDGEMCLYAPDVTQGADGRFYLYYVLDGLNVVSVAVSDTPAGRYRFFDYVRYEDGTLLGEREGDEPQFDPGVLFEGGKVYLYTGSCPAGFKDRRGPMVTVLNSDMVTVEKAPVTIAPSEPYAKGSGFKGHEFFEASSIRKIGEKYYFVYSSIYGHELCYAISDSPTGNFKFMGTIVSNADIGIDKDKESDMPVNVINNNHGGLVQVKGQWYIFYHRHTNGSSFCRQGCAEPVEILGDGSIPQVEITSCGLNEGALEGKGTYPAYIACNLYTDLETRSEEEKKYLRSLGVTRITQEGRDGDENPGYIENLIDGAVAGYKYFACRDVKSMRLRVRGYSYMGKIQIAIARDGETLAELEVRKSNEWHDEFVDVKIPDGTWPLFFRYKGYGSISLLEFELI